MKKPTIVTIAIASGMAILAVVVVTLFSTGLYRFLGPDAENGKPPVERTCQVLRHRLTLEGAEKREAEVCTLFCYAPFQTGLPYLGPSSVPVSCEWYGAEVTTERLGKK